MKLSAYLLTLLAFLIVVTIVFYLFISDLHDKKLRIEFYKLASNNTLQPKPHPPHNRPKHPSCVIILQRSIVDYEKQCERLQGIDNSWGRWVVEHDNLKLVAAVPPPYCPPTLHLQHITIFNLTIPSYQEHNPYTYLMHTLQYYLNTHADYDFLFLANDHTFLYPPNLLRFLHTLTPTSLAYSGN
ncbi:hypothetical protein EON65_37625, partial [archaeon]